jgi:hypothetical protein
MRQAEQPARADVLSNEGVVREKRNDLYSTPFSSESGRTPQGLLTFQAEPEDIRTFQVFAETLKDL